MCVSKICTALFLFIALSTASLAEKITSSELTPMVISKGERGGKNVKIDEHSFEVVFQKDGIMIYAKDDASDTIEARKVRGFVQSAGGPVKLNFERKDKSVFLRRTFLSLMLSFWRSMSYSPMATALGGNCRLIRNLSVIDFPPELEMNVALWPQIAD